MVYPAVEMIDIRQSVLYANYLKRNGWMVERIGEINYFIKKLPLIGSVLKIQRPKKIDFKEIEKLAKKYRVFQIILEPELTSDFATGIHNSLISRGFGLSKNPYLPTKTLHLNLTKPPVFEKETRRAIQKGSETTIKEYSSLDEIRTWRDAWKNSVKFTRFVPPTDQLINLRKSFPYDNSIFLASHNMSGRIIGGALFTRSSHDFGYYWYGFTNKEGRTSLSQYALLYQGILWAKRQDCKFFDFEGIYDPRFPNKSWLGFSHFKKSFGGYRVSYPGCFTKYNIFAAIGL